MSTPSVIGIIKKLGVPVALAVTILWAVNRFYSTAVAFNLLIVMLIFAGVLIFIGVMVWLVRKTAGMVSAARSQQKAEPAAVQGGVSAEDRARIAGLQENLETALGVIRESKLSRGLKKGEALYALPWILLFGDSESGKTQALHESGLDFAYSTADSGRAGKGAAAGCDYWFTREAVILDLNGRIAAEEDQSAVFSAFLDQLKRARSERPVDGVVVTVSMREILDQSPEQVEHLASRLRRRFDEMTRRLGIRFPIYVLFTKCDQISGFQEFFASFRSRDRAQVWGATISREQRRQMPAEQIFGAEFDRLVGSLMSYRLQLMAAEENPARISKIYGFPTRFAALRKKMEDFLGTLLQPTPYSERPIFRGFYLISAVASARQPGEARRPDVSDQRWDPDRRLAAPRERPAEAKTYFLESLFPRVILAERSLVRASVSTRLRRRLWLDIAFFSTLALCAVLLFGMINSFSGNLALIESVRLAARQVTDASWNPKSPSDLGRLEQLRQRIAELDGYSATRPRWTLGWGLYSGGGLAEHSRRVYLKRLQQAFVTPAAADLRNKLHSLATGAEPATSYSEFYTCLKAYLMMTDPAHAEPSFVTATLAETWKQRVAPEAAPLAIDQLEFYAQQLPGNHPELRVMPDAKTISLARLALGRYPPADRIYTRLVEEGNRNLPPFTLTRATGGKALEYLTSRYDVPGVFTEEGWRSYYKSAVGQASREAVQDDWVLGPGAAGLSSAKSTDADYQQILLDKYFGQYVTEWQKFLEGISVRPLAGLSEARAALDSFSREDSALSEILVSVAANTMLRKEPEKGTPTLFSSVLATLGVRTRVSPQELVSAVADQFQPLHEMVTSPDGGKSPSLAAKYILALGNVQVRLESLFGAGIQWDPVKAFIDSIANNISTNEFQEAYRQIGIITRQSTTRSTQPIGEMLEQPLRQAWSAMLIEAGLQLDRLWKAQISDGFKRELENGFPFNPAGRDVAIASVAEFLRPREGTLDAFYDKELKMFLTTSGDAVVPRTLMNAQVAFSQSFLDFVGKMNAVRQALFPLGSPDAAVNFDLTADATPGVTQSLLEIDGNRLLYRNEAPSPVSFSWPSKSGTSQARLTISLEGSGEHPSARAEGEWALFRLLGQARIDRQSQNSYLVVWSLRGADGTGRDVRYRLQARTIRNPFAPDFFRGIVCPERATQPAAYPGSDGSVR